MSDLLEYINADEDAPLIRAAKVVGFDEDKGTVEAKLVPYEVEITLYENVTEVFSAGAFARSANAPHRVKVTDQQHDRRVIGRAIELRDEPDGLYGVLKIADTAAGRDTLTLLREEVLDELSIEFIPDTATWTVERGQDDVTHIRHHRARLLGVSPVSHGAYGRDAKVLAVRMKQTLADSEAAAAEQAERAAKELSEIREAELKNLRGLSA